MFGPTFSSGFGSACSYWYPLHSSSSSLPSAFVIPSSISPPPFVPKPQLPSLFGARHVSSHLWHCSTPLPFPNLGNLGLPDPFMVFSTPPAIHCSSTHIYYCLTPQLCRNTFAHNYFLSAPLTCWVFLPSTCHFPALFSLLLTGRPYNFLRPQV